MFRRNSLPVLIILALVAASCGRTRPLGDGNLTSLRLVPGDSVLYMGQIAHLTVEARLADGTVLDVTSDPDLVLRVNQTDVITVMEDGLIHAVSPGRVVVLAFWAGKQAKSTIQVLEGKLTSLTVSPESSDVDSGKSIQLYVEGHLTDGTTMDLTKAAMGTSYSSDRPAVATPTDDGLVFAMNQGTATVTVTNGDFSTQSLFMVDGGQPPIVGITLSPAEAEIQAGDTLQLKLVGSYSDGTFEDITNDPETIFSSSNESIALVSTDGLVSAVGRGRAEITAVYRNLSSKSMMTVTQTGHVVGIDVLPKDPILAMGSSLQLSVTAIYDNGGRIDVTPLASFESSSPSVAFVDGNGLLQALSHGNTEITVEYSGFSSIVNVEVLDAELIDLWIVQDDFSLEPGETEQLTVMGRYSDGTEDDLSSSSKATVYYLDPVGILSISPDGLVTALAAGRAVVSARNSGLQAQVAITVTGQQITDFWMEPAQLTLSPGDEAAMVTWVRYSQGGTQDVTQQSMFSTDDPAIATVSALGLVHARTQGTTQIRARYGDWSDMSVVEVKSNPELVSIEVSPDFVDLMPGESLPLTVLARYSDGSSEDITSNAGYASSDPSVVTVSDLGVLSAVSPGEATIDVSWGGLSDQCLVSVQSAVLQSIELVPGDVTIGPNDSFQFTLVGHYSDGSQRDLTGPEFGTTYESSDETMVVVDTDGLARAQGAVGTAVVTARNAGFSDSSNVSIQQNPAPVINTISPTEVVAHSSGITLSVGGHGFIPTSIIRIDGVDLNTNNISDTLLTSVLPAWAVDSAGYRRVSVYNPPPGGGETSPLLLLVEDTPVISSVSPDSGVRGSSIRVGFWGSGLLGCTVTTNTPGISIQDVTWDIEGLYLYATLSLNSDAPLGPAMISLENLAGSAAAPFTVLDGSGYPDCVVSAGQVEYWSGVRTCNNVIVDTGALVVGTGLEPLQIIATGQVEIRGDIDVSGFVGQDGYYNPADGGAGGPGGGGGGGGGDGQLQGQDPSLGGDGSPPGQPGLGDMGQGTASGDGGGMGAGHGISGGCGQAGGGGAFGGDGGSGGGDLGIGTGGAGGTANTEGSLFNGGTGGGGGSTCGPNSGGGGGGGGGVLVIATTGGEINIEGVLSADGADGGDGYGATGSGGGGSGGRITITSVGGSVRIEDTVSARGGAGGRADAGDAGGGGSGGRIMIDAGGGGVDDSLGYYDVGGGPGGVSRDNGFDGQAGQMGVVDIRP